MGLVDRTPSMQRAKLLRGLRIGELNPTKRFSPIQAIRGLQIPGVQLQPRSVKSPPCCSRPPQPRWPSHSEEPSGIEAKNRRGVGSRGNFRRYENSAGSTTQSMDRGPRMSLDGSKVS